MQWNALTDLAQIEQIKLESDSMPVLVFKHSTRCSISSMALNRLEKNWKVSDSLRVKPYYLDLIAYRSLSNEMATVYQVLHQSPQVLLIIKGHCMYHASHTDITYQDLIDQLST